MQRLLTISIFLLLLSGFFHPISAITQDLGRHLLTGEIILKTQSIPKTNLFSYTNPDSPFINHHWFSEIIFFGVNQLAGFNGLLILTILVVTGAFGLLFFSSIKKGNSIALAIGSILYFRVLFERTDVRPEIFSFLFLSIFIVILYTYRQKYTRWIFLLPLIELLWVNMHIYFPIGIAVLGLFLVDEIIINRKNITNKHTGILVSILFVSSLVTILNPNGITGALYPFSVFQNYGYTIEENQNIFFLWNYFHGKTTILFFFISSATLFLSLLFTIKKIRAIDWLLSLFFVYLAISAERNFPLFVFGTFIPFTRNLAIVLNKLLVKPYLLKIIAFVILVVIFWNITQIVQIRGFGFGVESGAKNGVDFFLKNNLKGPLFNNFDIGSYLEYSLYPKEKVFIDGRPEAYPASFIQQVYIPMQTDRNLFNEMTKKYHLNTIFFAHTDQTPWGNVFVKEIVQNKMWKIAYLDDVIVILVKDPTLTGTQKNNLPIYREQTASIQSLFRLVNFFNKVGWKEQEEAIYQDILEKDPYSCFGLYNLSVLLSQRNDPAASLYQQRLNQTCR